MASIRLLHPLHQPIGERRLIDILKESLNTDHFSSFRIVVAYAKSGPILRLRPLIEHWRESGKTIEAIIGIDQCGTSLEALGLALCLFNKTFITCQSGITFHPKIYAFDGPLHSRVIVGSNNLTVGGTETNFEAAVCLELGLPDDAELHNTLQKSWQALLPDSCPATELLNASLLATLVANSSVLPERKLRRNASVAERSRDSMGAQTRRTGLKLKPPSAIPKAALANKQSLPTEAATVLERESAGQLETTQGLVIQIKPHHNGEIFLSVKAALQDPAFFKWPFNGHTVPKKTGNPSYPQLVPDPRVNITVFSKNADPVIVLRDYALNTVYYEKNSEIRVTASPLVDSVPPYSILIMERGATPEIDYEMTIHTPDSPDYESWLAACDQMMPSGGAVARKFGWF